MTAVSVVLAAAAAWLVVRPPRDRRLARVRPSAARTGPSAGGSPARPARLPAWGARAASALAGVGAWLLIGGIVGVTVGLVGALLLPAVLGRFESRVVRQRRAALDRQAPLLADLLSATLASGATLRSALGAVAVAVGEPTASCLRPVVTAIDLGADPVDAWRDHVAAESHVLVLDAVIRAAESGAPVSGVLARVADDLRREQRTVVEVAARTAGVRAVAPLAACFLPAFVLLGVVPVVASLAGAVLG